MDTLYVLVATFIQTLMMFVLMRYLLQDGYHLRNAIVDSFFALMVAVISLMIFDTIWILILIVLVLIGRFGKQNINNRYEKAITFMAVCILQMIILFSTTYIFRLILFLFKREFNLNLAISSGHLLVIAISVSELLITMITVYLIKKYNEKLQILKGIINDFEIKNKIFMMILGLFMALVTVLVISELQLVIPSILGVLIVVFVLVTSLILYQMIIFIKSYSIRQEAINISRQNVQLNGYMTNIEQQYTEFRKFKHDYNNLLLSLKTIIESNDSEQIKSYYNELSQQTMSTEHNDSQILVSVDKIINEPIRGLLIQKFFAARKMKMELLIETPDTKIEISNYVVSMVRILGILIDNAIEYLSENLEYEQLIKCAFINHQNSIEIVIENSASELIDLDKIFEQGYTTKGEERGLGLANVSDLVHKIPNLFMSTQLKNNKIQISLILKKEK